MNTAAASQGFMCKLKDRKEVAEGTMAFWLQKPLGWKFKAGQYLDMTLLDPSETDSEGNVRSFSIASAPHEETFTKKIGCGPAVHHAKNLKLLWAGVEGAPRRT